MNEIKKLFDIVGHRKLTLYIMLLSVVVAIIELVGLALLVPYISIATKQEVPQGVYVEFILKTFGLEGFNQFITFVTLIIIIFYIFRFFINIFFNYVSLRFVNKLRHIIMSKLFLHYAYIDYAHFVFRNTSDLKKTLLTESANTQNIIKSMIDFVSESCVLFFLLILIFYTNWQLSLILLIIFTIVFYSATHLLKNKIKLMADDRRVFGKGLHRQIDETLNNFKFTKLINAENIKVRSFEENSYGLYRLSSVFALLQQTPRFILETLGLIIIVGVIFYLVQIGSSDNLISTLGIYAIAFYRALPSLNRIIASFNNFQYFKNTIDQIYDDLQIKREYFDDTKEVCFKNNVELKNITFKYEGVKEALFSDFDLHIKSGDKVAIVGSSGSGKSTLVDILMGILEPQNGSIMVDNVVINDKNMKAWRRKFGYIPQDIYLFDASVADNVAFGREYNKDRIVEVLKQASIYDYLQTKNGIETFVGEGGVQLSGGQKQRIAIARALYHDPDILVLDEATSALDHDTEEKIMEQIYKISNKKTLIIIAHRLSTVKKCNKIIRIK